MPNDDKLLSEIRTNFTAFMEAWQSIRSEAKTDMRYVAGDPWTSADREFRRKHDRPCMTWDELSPYINQLVNDPRQNKRAIKISPKGSGATPLTAELREDKIREIQYNSRAQSACSTAFQGAAERSYGYFGINARLVASGLTDEQYDELAKENPEKLFEQELYIYRIPNPDTVLFNPNYKEQDCSDSTECFVEDKLSRNLFRQRYPKARFTDWQADYAQSAPGWQEENIVRVAAYYKVIIRKRKLYLLDGLKNKEDRYAVYKEELGKTEADQDKWLADEKNRQRIRRDRNVETRTVKQWMTNGLEILEEADEIPIPWIPIVPVFGKELWVDEGSGSQRKLISLVRMARDPMMFYAYIRSQEAEEFGMTPRAPFLGYVGQFETDKKTWETLNKVPHPYVQIDPITDPTGTDKILPLPTRPQFTPNAQAYEIAAEAARRAIRVACGGSDLPTAAQRNNEKSGVALQTIEANEDRGTFHFIDNYNLSLEHAGRIIDKWFPYVYDTKRDIAILKADGEQKAITINDEEFEEKGPDGQAVKQLYDAVTGDHGVTVSVSRDFDSLREEVNDFITTLIQEIQVIAPMLPPGAGSKILAIAIRLRDLGPLGDEMADAVDPPDAQKQQQMQLANLQQQGALAQKTIAMLQAKLQQLQIEKAGKVIDNQFKGAREAASAHQDRVIAQLNVDVQVLKALLASKQNISDQEYETFRTVWQENHGAAHEVAMQEVQNAHDAQQASAAQAAQPSSGGPEPVNSGQEGEVNATGQ